MPSEWSIHRLEELASKAPGAIAIGPFGSRLKADAYTESGVALIRGTNLAESKYLSGEFVYISEEKASELGNANLKPNDLVFPHRGSIGAVGLVPEDGQRYVLSTSLMKITLDECRVHPEFYYYFFRSERGRAELLKNASQVGTPGIATPLTSLRGCMVPFPSFKEQKAVAATLSALDDKIALLRETNTTLEAIAQALFKSWFVDFDPVRAKAEGREPEGVPPEIAALFPSEFENSSLGEIPKGWRVGTFGDLADVRGGGTPSTKEPAYWEGGVHCWVTPKDLSGMDTPVLLNTERKITDAGLNKISSGLLPIGTLLMSSRAPIGYLAIAEMPVAINQGFIAMKPKAGTTNLFLLSLVRSQMDEIKSHANGSTFMEISKAVFRPLKVVMPPVTVIQAYDSIERSLYERLVENQRQVGSLTEIRDTLLPRLMSGKLCILQIQEAVEVVST